MLTPREPALVEIRKRRASTCAPRRHAGQRRGRCREGEDACCILIDDQGRLSINMRDCQCTRAVVSTNTLAGEGEGRTLEMSLKSSISVWRREED